MFLSICRDPKQNLDEYDISLTSSYKRDIKTTINLLNKSVQDLLKVIDFYIHFDNLISYKI